MEVDIHKVIGKRGFVLPKHRYTGPYNPLYLQLDSNDRPLPGEESYNAVDAIAIRHDICYRDNESGEPECDRKITPRGRREKVDIQLVRGIIGLKRRLGNGRMEQSTVR